MYNSKEMVEMLSDAYRKEENSNNHKMFKLIEKELDDLYQTQIKTREYKDIEKAQGETLDWIADNFGLVRKDQSDDIFRVMIKAKALRSWGTGSFDNTTELIAYALNTDIKNIVLTEEFSEGGALVSINNLPIAVLNKTGMTVQEYEELLKDILPIGVGLLVTNVEGTFAFSSQLGVVENDNEIGLSDLDQTIGGTLGATVGTVVK